MKRIGFLGLAIIFLAAFVAPDFLHAIGAEDTTMYSSCAHCGMDREKFNYSRMLVEYTDGTAVGVCSLHCAAIEMAGATGKVVKAVKTADMISRGLINAEDAFWVVGGTHPGVMTKRPKWSFAKKEDAENYVKEKGGVLVRYQDALKAAYDDMYEDTKMIREKRNAPKPEMQGQGHQH